MNTRGLLLPAVLMTLAGCGGGGMDDYQEDDAVPPGAIPAAPDARPDAQAGAGEQPPSAAADTIDSAATGATARAETATTRVDRIIPR